MQPHKPSQLEPAVDTHAPGLGDADTASALAQYIEQFINAWEEDAEQAPVLSQFLPADEELRRLTLVELIKVDLEYRWLQRDLPKRLTEYIADHPELQSQAVPPDLIYEEFHIRRQCGLAIDPEEYLTDFPEHADSLRQLLGLQNEYKSTLITRPETSMALDQIEAGETIDDFHLILPLGRGAFARVFLARQKSMQRLVAVKISADHGTEPQTLAQLDHDYIVRVFDQRQVEEGDLRLLYMQYLPGGTLQSVADRVREVPESERTGQLLLDAIDATLEQRGEIRPSDSSIRRQLASMNWTDTVAWLGSRLAAALEYAHRRQVLHRDIKPANVLLTSEGVPKLGDFNISFSEEVSGTTAAAYFGGSMAYMSPEQLEACLPGTGRTPDQLDGRSDIYALGVMLWELLTGRRPFDDSVNAGWANAVDTMLQSRQRGVPPEVIAQLPKDCPAALRRVLLRCLEADRDHRWSDGGLLRQQFELCLDEHARELVDPPPDSLRLRLRAYAVPVVVVLNLIPNALAAIFNYQYNRRQIVEQLQDATRKFDMIQGIINGIAFPLGIALVGWLAWRSVRGLRQLARSGHCPPDDVPAIRRDVLRLGGRTAMICLAEWIIAGIAYPISIHYAAGSMPPSAYLHFIGSLVICGLVATAYPFFGVTSYAVRSIYPAMLQTCPGGPADARELQRLDQRLSWYLVIAASVPLLAISGLSLVRPAGSVDAHLQFVEQAVCLGGIAGFGLAYRFFRQLQTDIAALLRIVASHRRDAPLDAGT
ncbi:Serine/threonine-protein kinase PrkC [Maioricimonas rarisocia]|uniref:non-specific serine/threonine protein kinase n=1 Tax=Maioricimonas rarisocia TaxID=2528026 RepID=A0A517ZF12_9PLAN|nr:serine/threonine-protein kinase [Maioricimonas rarisocia]QDU41080.1 Serine/threonine-protein kinase PrkC [Maioricimonas rarisocia]